MFCKQKVACLRGFANCVIGRLSFFPLQFLFRLVPNRDSEQGLKPFQSISHLNHCGLVKNMQKSKYARVTDPSVTKTFAPRSARLVALLSCDSSCVLAGCSCLSGLNEMQEQRGV